MGTAFPRVPLEMTPGIFVRSLPALACSGAGVGNELRGAGQSNPTDM